MAPHSSTLAWRIPWTEEPDGLQSMRSLKSDKTERLHVPFSLLCIGEGNGNLLQCSCLENPRDGGAWWAAVYGVAQSRTRLERLSSSSSSSSLEQNGESLVPIPSWPPHQSECFLVVEMGQKRGNNSGTLDSRTLSFECLLMWSHRTDFLRRNVKEQRSPYS